MAVETLRQIPLGLELPPSRRRDDFIVTEANGNACRAVFERERWPDGRLALTGPARSGKTHLANIWAEIHSARIAPPSALPAIHELEDGENLAVDNADRVAGNSAGERRLFHLCNHFAEGKGQMLLTGTAPPGHWGIALPDLRSRLAAGCAANLGLPDDRLLSALLAKQLADNRVRFSPGVIEFILPRMERSYEAASAIARQLDRHALAAGRVVTRAMASTVIKTLPPAREGAQGETPR